MKFPEIDEVIILSGGTKMRRIDLVSNNAANALVKFVRYVISPTSSQLRVHKPEVQQIFYRQIFLQSPQITPKEARATYFIFKNNT